MSLIPFLNDRQVGSTRKKSFHDADNRPNLDNLLSRLACKENDVYSTLGDNGYVPPFACKFRKDKYLDLLTVTNEDGEITLIDTDGDRGVVQSFAAHNNAIFDFCWLPDKNHLVTASGDHRACLWDMNTCQMIVSFNKHIESVKSVDVCHNDSTLFATGSRDGTICVWDTRDKCLECGSARDKPSIYIQNPHSKFNVSKMHGKQRSSKMKSLSGVTAVAFQDNRNLASAGVADGVVKIWDLRKTYISKPSYVPSPRYQMKYSQFNDFFTGHGCTSIVFDSAYKKLYGCSTANKIFLFDCHSYNDSVVTYEGFSCDTFFIKLALSADDQYLACGSSNRKAYIWKTAKPGLPILELPGHLSFEVTAVAWGSDDVTKLATCGDDNRVLVWKTSNENCDDIFSKPSAYSSCDKSSENDHSQPSTTTSPHNRPIHSRTPLKVSAMKSIKSFFHPLSTPNSTSTIYTTHSSDSSVVRNNSDSIHQQVSDENSSALPVIPMQVLSPSKILNRNITVSPESLDSTPLQFKSHGKENHHGHSSSDSTSDTMTLSSTKRKSAANESTPKLHKLQAVKKRKQSSGSGKKKSGSSEGTIMKYFQVSLSPEE